MPLKIDNGTGYGFVVEYDDLEPDHLIKVLEENANIAIDPELFEIIEDLTCEEVLDAHREKLRDLGITIETIGDFFHRERTRFFFGLHDTVTVHSGHDPVVLGIEYGDTSTGFNTLIDLRTRLNQDGVDTSEPSWLSWLTFR